MRFTLTEEHHELARTARQVLAERGGPLPPTFGTDPQVEWELWRRLAGLGLVAPTIPEELGGSGAGLLEAVLVAEQSGAALAPVPYVPVAVAAELLVEAHSQGESSLAAKVLPGLADGSLLAVPAWETLPYTAAERRRPDPLSIQGGRVSGRLEAVPSAAEADLVLAIVHGALVAVWLDQPNAVCTPRPGLDVVEGVASIELADAEMQQVSSRPFADQALAAVRALHAAELVGLAQQALDSAVAYAKERRQFQRAIGSFQTIKHTLADRHAQVDSARLLLHWAAAAGDPHAAQLAVQAAADAADAATTDNLQIHGGMGFTWESSAHVLLKRARVRRALLGSPAHQLDAIADHLLGDANHQGPAPQPAPTP